jgi:hypothetical protein
MKKCETRSPINNLPVRQPGQSTREKFTGLFDDEIMPYGHLGVAPLFDKDAATAIAPHALKLCGNSHARRSEAQKTGEIMLD